MTSRAYSPLLTLLWIGMHGARWSPKAVDRSSFICSVPRCKHTEKVPTGSSARSGLWVEGYFKWICETAFPNKTKLNKGLRLHWVTFIKKSNLSLRVTEREIIVQLNSHQENSSDLEQNTAVPSISLNIDVGWHIQIFWNVSAFEMYLRQRSLLRSTSI